MYLTIISLMNAISFIILIMSFIIGLKVYKKTGLTIWVLVSAGTLVFGAEALANFLQWAEFYPDVSDKIGEYLSILFSLIWLYTSYRFMAVKDKKHIV